MNSFNIYSQFVFHPVGQGLFYSGKIFLKSKFRSPRFNFVFDCGASFDKHYLNKEIDLCKKSYLRKPLDVLFISHLDNDHVNGISRLLDGISCKVVYLPYLTPIERLYVAIRFASGKDEDFDGEGAFDYLRFLASPEDFLLDNEKFRVEKIVYINGNDDKTEFKLDDFVKPPPNFDTLDLVSQLIDDNSDNPEIAAIKEKHKQKVSFKKGNGKLFLQNIWDFYIFYNRTARINETELKILIEKTYNFQSVNQLTKDQLVQILKNKTKLKSLKKAFNKPRNTINTSGLLLMHKPIN